jgi:hypothetical protein
MFTVLRYEGADTRYLQPLAAVEAMQHPALSS